MPDQLKYPSFISATIDRFEGDFAVVVTDDRQQILWPKANLPSGVKEGERVKLRLLTFKDEQKERQKFAKALLESILNAQE